MRIAWKQIAPFTFGILISGCGSHPFCEIPEDPDQDVEFIEEEVKYPEPEVIVDPPKPVRPAPDAGTRHR